MIRELKSEQVRSLPKVTLTANEGVGARARHVLGTVTSALGSHLWASLSIVSLWVSSWLVGSEAVRHLRRVSSAQMLLLLLLSWATHSCVMVL